MVPEEVTLIEMQRFMQIVMESECRYYASDLFGYPNEQDLDALDGRIQHTLELFQTLHISTENHFQLVLRGNAQQQVFKDWKISDLACVYMLINGDPEDTQAIAEQQHTIIDGLLHHLRRPVH